MGNLKQLPIQKGQCPLSNYWNYKHSNVNINIANKGAGQGKVMGPVARFVGQGCRNFLLRELKFRRHVCSLENFSSWVWTAFLSEKAIQTSSGTYLISFPSSDSSDYCIENSSSGPSMSWLCWHNPAIWGSEQEDLTSFTLLTKCPFLENVIWKGFS